MITEECTLCKTALNVEKLTSEFCASINPYIGCVHGCKYCYVRAEKYSKGTDLSVVKVKYNIVDILVKELQRYLKKFPTGVIYLGTSSDPYQSVEQKYRLSHKILSILLFHTPYNIHIFTKSRYILEDLELFKKFKERLNISITLITTNEKSKEIFEPNASSIEDRLYCIKKLNLEGINCGVSIMPIIPYINDNDKELEKLFINIKNSMCKYIWWDYLTLRENISDNYFISQKQVFLSVISKNFPSLLQKYEFLYKNRISPNEAYQKMINKKVIFLAKKYNIYQYGPKWQKIQYQLFFDF